ncbi:growth arrest and DNA damage-inducible proteins-interacting protein 1-like [Oppia nitens]|uniref:growth arrest and DNA damage-inducible proteins-interacting protein 1-like n=1 Tax=Oppia nitens TaxID=1686743 RepID=UPI0023DB6436|nr:growth arrest and DNA damage-inducible proteins-interacting protein 1-like [Oppia nitens]
MSPCCLATTATTTTGRRLTTALLSATVAYATRTTGSGQAVIGRRYIFGGLFGGGSKKSQPPTVATDLKSLDTTATDAVVVEDEVKYTDDELMAIRDKSNLPASVRSMRPINCLPHLRTEEIRQYYAQYGRQSGLKPGVQWPARDELQWLRGYEQAFCRPLADMIAEVQAERHGEAKQRADRQREVVANLKKLPQMRRDFWQKYRRMHSDKEDEIVRKERLIQEVREFVGYDLDPRDPRFEEAIVKRDEEQKRLMKTQRKQERQRLTLERLQTLANEAMESEQQSEVSAASSGGDGGGGGGGDANKPPAVAVDIKNK